MSIINLKNSNPYVIIQVDRLDSGTVHMDQTQGTTARSQTNALRSVREKVGHAGTIEEALQAFYESIFEAVPVDEGALYAYDNTSKRACIVSCTERWYKDIQPISESVEIFKSFQTISLPEETAHLKSYTEILHNSGCTAGVLVPLGTSGVFVGFLLLGRIRMQSFSEEEIRLCDMMIEVGRSILLPLVLSSSGVQEHKLLSDVPVGFYIMKDDRIVYANEYMVKLFGYTLDEIIGVRFPLIVIVPEEQERFLTGISEFLQSGENSFHHTFTGLHKNGKRFDVETRVSRTRYQGQPALQGILIDITEQKTTERELVRRNRELYVLNILSSEISSARTLDDMYNLIDRVLKEIMNIDRVVIRLANRYPREAFSSSFDRQSMNGEVFADGSSSESTLLFEEILNDMVPILIDNCRQYPELDYEKTMRLGLRSTLALPIVSKDQILGMLRVDDIKHTGRFHQEDIQFLLMVCRHTANAIDNVIWYHREKSRSLRMESVRTLAREWMGILDPHELMRKAVRMVCESFGYDTTTIFLIRSASNIIHFHTGHGKNFHKPPEDFVLKMGQGLIGACAQKNSIVLVNDVHLDERWIPGMMTGTRSELCIPMRTHHGVIGVLDIQQTTIDAFTDEDGVFLQILADELTAVFENALLFEEIRYQANVLTNINDAIISADANWNIRGWNNGAERLYGWKASEVLGKNMYHLIHNEYIDVTPDDVLSAMIYHGGWRGKIRQYTKEGKVVHVNAAASTLRGSDGSIIGFVNVNRDISQERALESNLQETEGLLSSVIEQTPFGIEVFKDDGTLIRVNQTFLKMLNIPHREILEFHYNVLHDDGLIHRLGLMPKVEKAFAGESCAVGPIEIRPEILPPTLQFLKSPITVEIRMFAVFDDLRCMRQVVFIFEDISERVNLQRQLVQAQKMEAVGTLASGIAHDFNNLLGGILGYASFAKTKVASESPIFSYLDTIERSAQRASELTRQLLGFARRGKYSTEKIDCNDVIRDTITLLERSFDKRISVHLDLSAVPLTVEADAGQLEQALLNLCVNARDAMPGGGTLMVRSRLVDVNDEFVQLHINSESEQYVHITVEDTGIGMDEETQKHIFEPFFTTKEKGKGSGLGLSMVYGIVRNHDGYLDVHSELGRGSVFHLYFSYISGTAVQEGLADDSAAIKKGSEVILLVDDEEVIRDFTREVLEEQGYSVVTAKDGDDAIRLYAQLYTRIHAVVLDMVMPQKGGLETYREMKEINPKVKVLLSSGYSQDGHAQEILNEGVMGFVQKPYDMSQLFTALRKVLDS